MILGCSGRLSSTGSVISVTGEETHRLELGQLWRLQEIRPNYKVWLMKRNHIRAALDLVSDSGVEIAQIILVSQNLHWPGTSF